MPEQRYYSRERSDKVYQLLAHGRWFSPGTPASSTTKAGRNGIAEILLKMALSTKNQNQINRSIDHNSTSPYRFFVADANSFIIML